MYIRARYDMLRETVDSTLRNFGFILWVMKSHLKCVFCILLSVFCNTLASIDDVLKITRAASQWGPSDPRHGFEYIIKQNMLLNTKCILQKTTGQNTM